MSIKNKFCTLLLPTLLATTAFLLSTHAALHCNFVEFIIPPATFSHERAGLWNYQWWDHDRERYTCHAYPEEMVIDGRWMAARGFSSLGLMFGGLALVNVFLTCCKKGWCCCRSSSFTRIRCCTTTTTTTTINNNANQRQLVGRFYLLCALCSSLSLLFLHSNACQHNTIFNLMQDHQLKLSSGAKCTYAAMVLWFGASSLMLLVEERREAEEGEGGEAGNLEGLEGVREPLIQDVVFECEQSTYSGRDEE